MTYGLFALPAFAFAALFYLFAVNDFRSVQYIVNNSTTIFTHLLSFICGMSQIKCLEQSGFGYWRFGHLPLLLSKHLPCIAVVSRWWLWGLLVFVLLFVLFTSNPFTRTFLISVDGKEL